MPSPAALGVCLTSSSSKTPKIPASTDALHLEVAREVIDALLATGKHEITILSRTPVSPESVAPGTLWRAVDYSNKEDLTSALVGTHTVLSFIQLLSDPDNHSQKTLIDACIAAGVKRFAPSEYASAGTNHMPWWSGKEAVRRYLRAVNTPAAVLEYTLFQPGLFLDYLASPYQTATHVRPLDTVFDMQNRRAIVVAGHEDAVMTFTSARDLAAVVALTVEHPGRWPEVAGIKGNRVTFSEVVKMGEMIRGMDKSQTNSFRLYSSHSHLINLPITTYNPKPNPPTYHTHSHTPYTLHLTHFPFCSLSPN